MKVPEDERRHNSSGVSEHGVANTQHAQARYEQERDRPRARYHGPSLFYVQLDSLKIFAWYKKGPTRDR